MSKVTLVSSDGVKFSGVDVEIAGCSKTIETMLENLGVDDKEGEEDIIPVPNVTGEFLKIVLDWGEIHRDKTKWSSPATKAWEEDLFGRLDKRALFGLTNVANYLDVETLLSACTTEVAQLIDGKSVKEIHQLFMYD